MIADGKTIWKQTWWLYGLPVMYKYSNSTIKFLLGSFYQRAVLCKVSHQVDYLTFFGPSPTGRKAQLQHHIFAKPNCDHQQSHVVHVNCQNNLMRRTYRVNLQHSLHVAKMKSVAAVSCRNRRTPEKRCHK